MPFVILCMCLSQRSVVYTYVHKCIVHAISVVDLGGVREV